MDTVAKIVPSKCDETSSVAEDPTSQKMLAAFAPFLSRILRPTMVVNVEPILKRKVASAFPCPSSVRSPAEMSMLEPDT
jgi:hypothetical protein